MIRDCRRRGRGGAGRLGRLVHGMILGFARHLQDAIQTVYNIGQGSF